MNVMSLKITNKEYNAILKEIGVTYLGGYKHSAKMNYSYNNGTLTYCLYLAPSTMANVIGRNGKVIDVCPNSKWCKDSCLNGAGHNKADILARGVKESFINISRIKKTRYFFSNREKFMLALIYEIVKAQNKAQELGMEFSVRLNGTSDLSPEDFSIGGLNILQLFPMVQFYDYTKVPQRLKLNYPNYDVTLSFNGWNWHTCDEYLKNGGKVAVVFDTNHVLPETFHGFKVIDANGYDMRYLDPKGTIMGLHYHSTANDYKNGKYNRPNTRFIVRETDNNIKW